MQTHYIGMDHKGLVLCEGETLEALKADAMRCINEYLCRLPLHTILECESDTLLPAVHVRAVEDELEECLRDAKDEDAYQRDHEKYLRSLMGA